MEILIYSAGSCILCGMLKTFLGSRDIAYSEVRVDLDKKALKTMRRITNNNHLVPQIVINGQWIGGYQELYELYKKGELTEKNEIC